MRKKTINVKPAIKIVTFLVLLIVLSSCMRTRVTIGDGPVAQHTPTRVHSTSKQFYVLWGFVPIGHSQPVVPQFRGGQIVSGFEVTDAIITVLTVGLISSKTIQVRVADRSEPPR